MRDYEKGIHGGNTMEEGKAKVGVYSKITCKRWKNAKKSNEWTKYEEGKEIIEGAAGGKRGGNNERKYKVGCENNTRNPNKEEQYEDEAGEVK